jgi:hypothetical protein
MKPAIAEVGASRRAAESRAKERATRDEPRTGVVRKVDVQPAIGPDRVDRASARSSDARTWRCLEWGKESKPRAAKRSSEVSIVQLSTSGKLLRQRGPDEWLPEAGEFVHRMALLVAQGLGFDDCTAVHLRGSANAIAVSQAGPAKVVGVAGPLRQLSKVLRRVGLE